ncbi:DegT/DnrJ/EryC1/StrS family aminotransferase [Aliiglaciecola sp.]|nr:DegT/DnrJ/EryC1/StrS family aminotransferase [Aliiglaciecola sp.]
MQFRPALLSANDFPDIQVKSNAAIKADGTADRKLPQGATKALLVDRGRTALFLIAQTLKNKTVWAPEYHCPAMIEPLYLAGVDVKFYPIDEHFHVDIKFVNHHVKTNEALLGVRFFGSLCNLSEVANVCRKNHILFIEDLAHAGLTDSMIGDIAITSLTKFYPDIVAAELILGEQNDFNEVLDDAYAKLPSRLMSKFRYKLLSIFAKLGLTQLQNKGTYTNTDVMHKLSKKQVEQSISTMSGAEIRDKRRANFVSIAEVVDAQSWARVACPLEYNMVPYVVPVYVDSEERFKAFRLAGIQALRWEEIATQINNTDVLDMRGRLIQLPCHQDLTEQQLSLIKQTIIGQQN